MPTPISNYDTHMAHAVCTTGNHYSIISPFSSFRMIMCGSLTAVSLIPSASPSPDCGQRSRATPQDRILRESLPIFAQCIRHALHTTRSRRITQEGIDCMCHIWPSLTNHTSSACWCPYGTLHVERVHSTCDMIEATSQTALPRIDRLQRAPLSAGWSLLWPLPWYHLRHQRTPRAMLTASTSSFASLPVPTRQRSS